jgi:DNA-binding NtrC family response regulator
MSTPQRLRSPSLAELAQAMDIVTCGMLDSAMSLAEAVRTFELRYVEAALERYGGNQQRAAAALQIHRNTLRAKLKRGPRRVS